MAIRVLVITVFIGSCLLAWQLQRDRQRLDDEILRRMLQVDQQVTELAKRKAAEYAEREFDEKFNIHAQAMNAIAEDRRNGLANVKRFDAAAKSWDKLYGDPGWLKRKKE